MLLNIFIWYSLAQVKVSSTSQKSLWFVIVSAAHMHVALLTDLVDWGIGHVPSFLCPLAFTPIPSSAQCQEQSCFYSPWRNPPSHSALAAFAQPAAGHLFSICTGSVLASSNCRTPVDASESQARQTPSSLYAWLLPAFFPCGPREFAPHLLHATSDFSEGCRV